MRGSDLVVRRRDGEWRAGKLSLEPRQLVLDGPASGVVGVADLGAERLKVALEQRAVQLDLGVARDSDGAVVGQPRLRPTPTLIRTGQGTTEI